MGGGVGPIYGKGCEPVDKAAMPCSGDPMGSTGVLSDLEAGCAGAFPLVRGEEVFQPVGDHVGEPRAARRRVGWCVVAHEIKPRAETLALGEQGG